MIENGCPMLCTHRHLKSFNLWNALLIDDWIFKNRNTCTMYHLINKVNREFITYAMQLSEYEVRVMNCKITFQCKWIIKIHNTKLKYYLNRYMLHIWKLSFALLFEMGKFWGNWKIISDGMLLKKRSWNM